MDKEKILKRIDDLHRDRLNHEKMQILLDGALQDCNHWLKELEKEEKPDGT